MDPDHPAADAIARGGRDARFWSGLRAGAEHFDHGRWWHAHESWETVWRAYGGAGRDYLKGLIQLAAAHHHLERGNRRAACKLLDSGIRRLGDSVPLAWPFDTGHLLLVSAALAARIDAGIDARSLTLRLGPMLEHWAERDRDDLAV